MEKGNKMAYLIDRNKLWNYIKEQINPYGKPFKGSAYEFGTKLMDYILDMETIDAKPVVHGKWNAKVRNNGGYTVSITCSACGYSHSKVTYNFCPECGADMRKGGASNV